MKRYIGNVEPANISAYKSIEVYRSFAGPRADVTCVTEADSFASARDKIQMGEILWGPDFVYAGKSFQVLRVTVFEGDHIMPFNDIYDHDHPRRGPWKMGRK